MKYMIFCIAIRMARWACALGDSDDMLEKADELERNFHYWAKLDG